MAPTIRLAKASTCQLGQRPALVIFAVRPEVTYPGVMYGGYGAMPISGNSTDLPAGGTSCQNGEAMMRGTCPDAGPANAIPYAHE